MKREAFNWETFPSSGAFCSQPCAECPVVQLLSPADIETALTVDEILTCERADVIRAANYETLGGMVTRHSQFVEAAHTDMAIELDLAGQAAQRIANGHCPNYQVNE